MPFRLPNHLQGQLDLAGCGLGGSNKTGAGDRFAALVEDGEIAGGRSEVGVIKDIEEFCPELNVHVL